MKTTLTDRTIKAAKPAANVYDIPDAVVPGFILRVMPSGVKSFALIARYPGSNNPTRRSLGVYGAILLQPARDKARNWLELLARGVDPADEIRRERDENARKRRDTIAAVAEEYISRRVIGPNPSKPRMRSAARVVHNLRDILIPMFGHRAVTELTVREVSLALAEIEKHGTDHGLVRLGVRKKLHRPGWPSKPSPVQARNLFCYLDALLRWAAGTSDYDIDRSPLTRVSKADRFGTAPRRSHYLNDAELGAAWRASGELQMPHRQFYRMLMLTGLRLSEVREATWDEFNLKAKEWTIPSARMKGRDATSREHIVPLTPHMLEVLEELYRGPRGDYVFSVNQGASPIAKSMKAKGAFDRIIAQDMQGRDRPFVLHDFRRSLRTLGTKLGIAQDVLEAMLAHKRPGIIGVYDVGDYRDERRDGHIRWGDFLIACGNASTNVVRLRKRK